MVRDVAVACLTVALASGVPAAHAEAPAMSALPGEFAIFTFSKGNYLTAVGGGGRIADVVATDRTQARAWEKFRLWGGDPVNPQYKAIQTASGNFLTAVDGGGRITDVVHTDATQIGAWERFRFVDLGAQFSYGLAIQTVNAHFLTAVGNGGKTTDAVHTDATKVGDWERWGVTKCGDLGSGYQYRLRPYTSAWLLANGGGGLTKDALRSGGPEHLARFTLMRQGDGSYALQTSNGINYVTAVGGGGLVQSAATPDILQTDRTQIQAWEKFRFVDQGDCTYTIQTVSGYYFGVTGDLFTTRRSTISFGETWILTMVGL
jgi:hypothetical protein